MGNKSLDMLEVIPCHQVNSGFQGLMATMCPMHGIIKTCKSGLGGTQKPSRMTFVVLLGMTDEICIQFVVGSRPEASIESFYRQNEELLEIL